MRTWALVLLTACGSSHNHPDAPKLPPATYAQYIVQWERHRSEVKTLPRSLSPRSPVPLANIGMISPSEELTDVWLSKVNEQQICFTDRYDGVSIDASPDGLAASLQANLATLSIRALPSISAESKTLAWPPAADATKISSVAVVLDEIKDHVDPDGTIVSKRVVTLQACAPSPIALTTKFLLISIHNQKEAADPAHEEQVQLQHDSLYLFPITDDGTFDLTK